MFSLYDGRKELYQWDLNRKVIVSDNTVTEVHFCNRTDDCSLVVPTYRLADANILVADIPNILLQDNWNIRVYAYCTDYTKVEALFKVKPRTRPADYVYTETEVLQYSSIDRRITELEESIDTVVAEEVNKYIEENPIEVPTKVSELENDSKYTTEEYVSEAIAGVVQPETDLTNYYTKTEVDDIVANAQGSADLTNYYTKEETDALIPDVSTKLNAFTGATSAKYLTASNSNGQSYIKLDEDGLAASSNANAIVKRDATTGDITVPNTPSKNWHAASKEYVDNALVNAGGVSETKVQEMIDASLGVIENGTY